MEKIIIATPFYEQKAWADFTESLANTCAMLVRAGAEVEFWQLSGDSYVDRARNSIAARFLASNASHLVFIDSDMGWGPTAFVQLMSANKEVVGATYPVKNRWGDFAGLMHCDAAGYPIVDSETGLISAFTLPMGFTRIARSAFEAIRKHEPGNVYEDSIGEEGKEHAERTTVRHNFFGHIHEGARVYREDAAFCLRCHRAGVNVWCEPRITLRHWGVKAWEGNFHEMLLKQPKPEKQSCGG